MGRYGVRRRAAGKDSEIRGRRKKANCLTGGTVLLLVLYVCTAVSCSSSKESVPRKDAEGYYLLGTKEDFEWFTHYVGDKNNRQACARLTGDIVLNDFSDLENWRNEPPENQYYCIAPFSGTFDGNGYALRGYYSGDELPIFSALEEGGVIRNLTLSDSYFQTTLENSSYVETLEQEGSDGEIYTKDVYNVLPAMALCGPNRGLIQGCTVDAVVEGAWQASGVVSGNYGEMQDCRFMGRVVGGMEYREEDNEVRNQLESWKIGGLAGWNEGLIENCTNEGAVFLYPTTNTYATYMAGGICGWNLKSGVIRTCVNRGEIHSIQLAGGIVGANGKDGCVEFCENNGTVYLEDSERDFFRHSMSGAGICGSNGGRIDSCISSGTVSFDPYAFAYADPHYGIANNSIHPDNGTITNCYYLGSAVQQVYRQKGVYKLSEEEFASVEKYLQAPAAEEQEDSYRAYGEDERKVFGTDEEDFIHLYRGPKEDTLYTVKAGDSLWEIAEEFYGDGLLYEKLVRTDGKEGDILLPGDELEVPGLHEYLLHAAGEEGFGYGTSAWPSIDDRIPPRYIVSKPEDWYYGAPKMDEYGRGLDALWPKAADKEKEREEAYTGVRLYCGISYNTEGDFLAADWKGVKKSIEKSGRIYCGPALTKLRFYRYGLDNMETLYGYTFRLARAQGDLNCAVFYRLREGLLVEWIGIESAENAGEEKLFEFVRYQGARVDPELTFDADTAESNGLTDEDYLEYSGGENWEYKRLHNPFAIALHYDMEKYNSPYVLATGQ